MNNSNIEIFLSSDDQQKTLHQEISGQGFGYHDILKIAKDIKYGAF